jgi:hypothetical protein
VSADAAVVVAVTIAATSATVAANVVANEDAIDFVAATAAAAPIVYVCERVRAKGPGDQLTKYYSRQIKRRN